MIVVDIVVPEEDLVKRLAGRRVCSKCGTNAEPVDGVGTACQRCGGTLVYRADDSEQVVLERLKVYRHASKPLVEYYRERPTFCTVNGAQPPDRVAEELGTTIDITAAQTRAVAEARGAAGR